MTKKLLALIAAMLMVVSASACGNKANTDALGNHGTGHITDGYVFKGKSSTSETVELGMPEKELDPAQVYSKITYTPEMFYGDYRLRGGDEAEDEFGANANYFTCNYEGEEVRLSTLPFRIKAGKETMSHKLNYIEGHNWMELYFLREYSENNYSLDFIYCSYTVDGNKLILKPLDKFEVDNENNKITYALSDMTWEYTFAFSGRYLTLTSGQDSVTLTTGLDAYGKIDYFSLDNYLSEGSKSAADIDQVDCLYNPEGGYNRLFFELADGTASRNSIAVLQENGLFTFTLALEDSTKTYQYVYFYCGRDGLILTDGTEVYYYNETYSDRQKNQLNKYLSEDQTAKLEDMSESQLDTIIEKKENLLEDLIKAFNDAGIKVTVDEKSGELAMDSSVLFGGNSSVLTDDGKAFLNKFLAAYTSIIFSEKYDGFVSKTMVEGHAAPVGYTYEESLPFSKERADSVRDYCISLETGVDTSKLADNLEAIGYSNSRPVIDENGNVDLDASRRVSFRFIINLDHQ